MDGAEDWTRTSTGVTPLGPEPSASTNSATPALPTSYRSRPATVNAASVDPSRKRFVIEYPDPLVSSSSSHPSRESVLTLLAQHGPSTVTELMRAAGPEKGARRQYRQLLRVMLRDGAVVLDRKGKMSLPE